MPLGSKKDFFISYTQADLDWAERVAWQLEEAEYNVADSRLLRGSIIPRCKKSRVIYSDEYFRPNSAV